MYELVTNEDEAVVEREPIHFGDMRERFGGEYVVNVLGRGDGGAVMGVGLHRYVPLCIAIVFENGEMLIVLIVERASIWFN